MAGRDLSVVEVALHKDCVSSLSAAIQQLGLTIHGFYDWSTKQGLQQRNLLSMAAAACSPACVAALLHAGAQPNAASPSDGNTALHCACSSASCNTARIIALLVRAGADKLLPNRAGRTASDLLALETSQVRIGPGVRRKRSGGTPAHFPAAAANGRRCLRSPSQARQPWLPGTRPAHANMPCLGCTLAYTCH